jgi:hypothetical protein
MFENIRTSKTLKIHLGMFFFHTSLFFTLLIFGLVIFQGDVFSYLWYCTHCNDSWKFIANTLNPTPSPYPFHLIATSIHYLILYLILSMITSPQLALTLSILIIQFTASLLTIYLLYQFILHSFGLSNRQCLLLVAFYDLIIISPFLLLATSEILYIFYQLLSWTFLVRQRYSCAAIAAAMTFALRFNGAFFVVGILLVFFLKWWKTKKVSPKLLVSFCTTATVMFVVGFSSFILSWYASRDFWLPMNSQKEYYLRFIDPVSDNVFTVPFLWWPRYSQQALLSNSLPELLFYLTAVLALALGFMSLYMLIRWSKEENTELQHMLTIFFCSSFLGNNFVASGLNFARFIGISFPLFPVFPIWLKDKNLSKVSYYTLLLLSGIIGLSINIGMWLVYLIP